MSARLRFVHTEPNSPAVDILIDGRLVFPNLAYPSDTSYVEFSPGAHEIRLCPSGSHRTLVGPLSLMLTDKQDYTVLVEESVTGQHALSIKVLHDHWMRPAA
jgi:hypothetical protein